MTAPDNPMNPVEEPDPVEELEPTTVAPDATVESWHVLLIEDESDIRRQVHEFLDGEVIAGRPLVIHDVDDFDIAFDQIRQRRVDLIILDIFRGKAFESGDDAGLRVLANLQQTGFVCVVLYTAHPEKVESHRSPFVRLVAKDDGGLDLLRTQIDQLFALRIPQMYRAMVTHLDHTLRDYMWGFVEKSWEDLEPLAGKPEFLRIILQRLSATLSHEGIDQITRLVFGVAVGETAPDTVHSAEFYIMPPLTPQMAQLGDVRVRQVNNQKEHLIVLWPSCDTFVSGTRAPKVDRIHCAHASPLADADEVIIWKKAGTPSNGQKSAVRNLLKNRRNDSGERFHALPGLCDIPDLLVDFQHVEIIPLADLVTLKCLATLASPYAESLSARYVRYIGRLGTPDLDADYVMRRMWGAFFESSPE